MKNGDLVRLGPFDNKSVWYTDKLAIIKYVYPPSEDTAIVWLVENLRTVFVEASSCKAI